MSEIHDKPPVDEAPKVDLTGNNWELPTDLRVLGQVEAEVKRRLAEAGWLEEDIDHVYGFYLEMISNAIMHAHQKLGDDKVEWRELSNEGRVEKSKSKSIENPDSRSVHVPFDLTEDGVSGSVRDQGEIPFEPTDEKDKAVTEKLLEPSGRGILMTEFYLGKSVEYNPGPDGKGTVVSFNYQKQSA